MSGIRVVNPELRALGLTLPGFVERGKVIASLPSLGLLTIAGMTPESHEVTYLEVDDPADFEVDDSFDLVGISSLTASIDEAYRLADEYRGNGARVVMGGLHASVLPEEALDHCHAVLTGNAEGVWRRVLDDAENDQLSPIYVGDSSDVFGGHYQMPAFQLLRERSYNRVTIQTSRGCPRACEFCGASRLISPRFQQKAVERVIAEIREAKRWTGRPFYEFADDNTFLNQQWGKEFLRELIPEEVHWFTETDASVADDAELLDLLADSGCRQLLIGFESPRADDLSAIDPKQWKSGMTDRYQVVIDRLQSRGISVNGCFILGLDNQTPEIFPAVRDFVESSGLAEVQCTVLTPFPGTSLFGRLRQEGRLLSERFWDRCTLFDVNYRPSRMSVSDLESGIRWLFEELYCRQAYQTRRRRFVRQARPKVR